MLYACIYPPNRLKIPLFFISLQLISFRGLFCGGNENTISHHTIKKQLGQVFFRKHVVKLLAL